jgi:hypothetical protein
MKTANRENPNRWVTVPSIRVRGAAVQNGSRSIQWAAKQEKLQPQEMCFFLTSTFIELIRSSLFAEIRSPSLDHRSPITIDKADLVPICGLSKYLYGVSIAAFGS